MATTRIIPMHINKGRSMADCLTDRTAYAKNPDKTESGKFISSFKCSASTVEAEFLLSKRQYKAITGRGLRDNDVLAYQLRQSFKPNEVTPEEANKIGYELAMCFTKGQHAFIVATHVDKEHIHNHIIWNSTSLDSTRKFRNFWGSTEAVRKISDKLCLEHGLSIVEIPQESGKHYGKWLDGKKALSFQDKLRSTIDAALEKKPVDFEAFLAEIRSVGYEIKRGKYIAFRIAGQRNFTRLRSLGQGYSEDKIRAVIAGLAKHRPRKTWTAKQLPKEVNLLIDIQEKLKAGKGASYERWAKVFNIKQMAQTMNYLTENKLLEYSALAEKATSVTVRFNELSAQMKNAEARMTEIAVLKTHIINYSKTRDIYIMYRKAGYSKKFYNAHAFDILLHKAAKAAFDVLPDKKLPTIKALQTEYAELISTKKEAYTECRKVREEMQTVLTAKANVDRLLGRDAEKQEKENERKQR